MSSGEVFNAICLTDGCISKLTMIRLYLPTMHLSGWGKSNARHALEKAVDLAEQVASESALLCSRLREHQPRTKTGRIKR